TATSMTGPAVPGAAGLGAAVLGAAVSGAVVLGAAAMVRVPPGRAGRMWLLRRMHTGRHAADLLDRKVRILRTELRRCQEWAAATGEQWREAWAQADRWERRGAALGGRRELRLAAVAEPARASVEWANVMGLRYPGGVH